MHIRTNLKPATIFALILVVFAFLVQLIVYLLNWVRLSCFLALGQSTGGPQGAKRRIADSMLNFTLQLTANPLCSGLKIRSSSW